MNNLIIDAIGRCNPDEPLNPGDPRWCDFDPARGTNLHDRIPRRLRGAEAERKFSHIALAGHRGCGKSTELARVMDRAKDEGSLPLYAVVNEQADPNEIGFGDLFLLMLRLLDEAFENDKNLKPLPDKTVRVVTDWFQEVTHVEQREVERVVEFSGEAALGGEELVARHVGDEVVEIEVPEAAPTMPMVAGPGMEEMAQGIQEMMSSLGNSPLGAMMGGGKKRRRTVTVKEALPLLAQEEAARLVEQGAVAVPDLVGERDDGAGLNPHGRSSPSPP